MRRARGGGVLSGILLFSCLGAGGSPAWAAATRSATIHVSLFGQPCDLQGPVDEPTLKLIHSLSPEQLYPPQDTPLSSEPTRRALDRLKAATHVPAALDLYRERLSKRLEAQLAFLNGVDSYRKDHKLAALLAAGRAYLSGKRQRDFEASLKKAEAARTLAGRGGFDPIFDSYNEGIEADPEEEFHRAIQRLKVQYACSFEEGGEGPGSPGSGDAD
jgi:hypothetical protein